MRPELATLIEASKKAGIYETFVKETEEQLIASNNPALLINHIQDLLTLHEKHFIFRSDVQNALVPSRYHGGETSRAFAFAFVAQHQPLLPKHVALIKNSERPEETAEVIVSLTRCGRSDLIAWCAELSEPALSAKTMSELMDKGLLTDELLTFIDRHSKNDDNFIKLVSFCLQADCFNERRSFQLQSAPRNYLSSVRWTLCNIRDLPFHWEAPTVFDWFFPPRPLSSLPADFLKSMFWKVPTATRSETEINRVSDVLQKLQATSLTPAYLFKKQYEWLLSDEAMNSLWQYVPDYGTKEKRDALVVKLLAVLDTAKNPDPQDIYSLVTEYLDSEKQATAAPEFSQGEYADFLDAHPEIEIPEKFICPITRTIITDPMTNDGKQFYEAKALAYQIYRLHKNPITGEGAFIEQFRSAPERKAEIDAFMDQVKESLSAAATPVIWTHCLGPT